MADQCRNSGTILWWGGINVRWSGMKLWWGGMNWRTGALDVVATSPSLPLVPTIADHSHPSFFILLLRPPPSPPTIHTPTSLPHILPLCPRLDSRACSWGPTSSSSPSRISVPSLPPGRTVTGLQVGNRGGFGYQGRRVIRYGVVLASSGYAE